MHYQELRPAEPLSKLIKCIWLMQSDADRSAREERILPDGCTEIVFNLGDPFEQHTSNGSRERQPLTLLVGQMQRPLLISPTGRVQLVGIRFWPGGAYPFLRLPQKDIANRIMNLDEVWGRSARVLQSRIADAQTNNESARQVETELLARLNQFRSNDETVMTATGLILRADGRLSIRSLAEHLGMNSRTLDRRFNERVGLTPKALCRIVRFQQVFKLIQPGLIPGDAGSPDWARIAVDCGFYDQPHFIKEFKTFTGKEPTAYFSENNVMSDHFTGTS